MVCDGIHSTITIRRPASGVVLVVFKGPDLGEFGDKAFHELAKDLAPGLPLELFFDASECIGPTVNVSSEWAQWMINQRTQLYRVNLLCSSRYVEVTANFVRRLTEFGERKRIYAENDAFYQALSVGAGKSAMLITTSPEKSSRPVSSPEISGFVWNSLSCGVGFRPFCKS